MLSMIQDGGSDDALRTFHWPKLTELMELQSAEGKTSLNTGATVAPTNI